MSSSASRIPGSTRENQCRRPCAARSQPAGAPSGAAVGRSGGDRSTTFRQPRMDESTHGSPPTSRQPRSPPDRCRGRRVPPGDGTAVRAIEIESSKINGNNDSAVRPVANLGAEHAPGRQELRELLLKLRRNDAADAEVGVHHRSRQAPLASATVVPPFTLFEFIASKKRQNLEGKQCGESASTCVVDAPQRSPMEKGSLTAQKPSSYPAEAQRLEEPAIDLGSRPPPSSATSSDELALLGAQFGRNDHPQVDIEVRPCGDR